MPRRGAGCAAGEEVERAGRSILGADKNCDTQDLGTPMRKLGVRCTWCSTPMAGAQRSTVGPRGTPAARSASASASGARRCSARARRSAACGGPCRAGPSGSDEASRCDSPPATSSDCRSCSWRPPERRRTPPWCSNLWRAATENQPSLPQPPPQPADAGLWLRIPAACQRGLPPGETARHSRRASSRTPQGPAVRDLLQRHTGRLGAAPAGGHGWLARRPPCAVRSACRRGSA